MHMLCNTPHRVLVDTLTIGACQQTEWHWLIATHALSVPCTAISQAGQGCHETHKPNAALLGRGDRNFLGTMICCTVSCLLWSAQDDQLQYYVQGYKEGDLTFPPTYKFDPGTDVYDSSGKSRIPSWCDRVLWRCNTDTVELLQYTHVPQLKVSDHR